MNISGDNNTQLDGDNNVIGNENNVTHNHFYNAKQIDEFEKVETLPFTVKVYRKKNDVIDYLFYMAGILGVPVIQLNHFGFEWIFTYIIFLFLTWFLLPQKFSSLFITVYSHSFTIGDNEIEYNKIRSYQYRGRVFSYKLHEDDKTYSIYFYNSDHAEYLFYKMDKYAIFYGTKL